jgi:AraC-like DNA-binding protein
MPANGLIVRAARAGDVEVAELYLAAGSRTSSLTLNELEMMFIDTGELRVLRDGRLLRAQRAFVRRLDVASPIMATQATRLVCVRVPSDYRGADPRRVQALEALEPMPESSHDDFRRLQRTLSVTSAARSMALEALALLIVAAGETAVRSRDQHLDQPAWLGKLIESIGDGVEPVNLQLLAREAGVSTAHLNRAFRSAEGCTIGEYRRRLRISFACRLLEQTRSPLSQVAIASGFADQAHFSRLFKRQTGMTPREYRARTGVARPDAGLHLNFDPAGVYPFRSRTADGRPYDGVLTIRSTTQGYSAVVSTSVMPDVVADTVAIHGRRMIITASVPAGLAFVHLHFTNGRIEGEWRLAGKPTAISGSRDSSLSERADD